MSCRRKRLPKNNSNETIGVYLRLRPQKNISEQFSLVKFDDKQVKTNPPPGKDPKLYTFTRVFDENTSQSEIFNIVAKPVVEDFITASKDGLIFTYGVSGSGKTYTMEGKAGVPDKHGLGGVPVRLGKPAELGLVYRTIDFIFNSIKRQQTEVGEVKSNGSNLFEVNSTYYPDLSKQFCPLPKPSDSRWLDERYREKGKTEVDPSARYCFFMSLIELYNGDIIDLLDDLNPNKKERKVTKKDEPQIRNGKNGQHYVGNIYEVEVKDADMALRYYRYGVNKRNTAKTNLNQDSSRGHCVLTLRLVKLHKSFDDEYNQDTLLTSQLCLVDLAGSERSERSGAKDETQKEANKINVSLGELRNCIAKLCGKLTGPISYRNNILTRLFESYFQGRGTVRMILCVNPSPEDFNENKHVLEFGLDTQDVPIDFAPTPPKMLKRSRSLKTNHNPLRIGTIYEYSDKKFTCPDFEDFAAFMKYWNTWLIARRPGREKTIEALLIGKTEFRKNLEAKMNETKELRKQYEEAAEELRQRENEIREIEGTKRDEIHYLKRHVQKLEENTQETKRQNHDLVQKNTKLKDIIMRQSREETLLRQVKALLETQEARSDVLKKVTHLLKKIDPQQNPRPSAPVELEPLQSSSPVDFLPTSEMTDSNTPPTTTNSSSDAMDFNHHHHHNNIHNQQQQHTNDTRLSPLKNLLASPNSGGIPIVNPRHNRSLSCSSMQWIHHRPQGTIDTGTVLKPKFKNGKAVRNLRSSDILRKDAAGYSVVHQGADSNGDVETSVYKGHIISTVCGGAQVILNDIETMRQVSPEKKLRAASDAHYTH